jgi:16S rRNA (adenine1518-N6/adenine1519-N6)-dimethyltransferase
VTGAALETPIDVRRMLREAGLQPRKSLGQNFLLDERALAQVADCADIGPADTVLEIGAGLGSLTRHLAARAARVIAVELDTALIPLLQQNLASFPNVKLVCGDILALPLEKLLGRMASGGYKVAANIPYYITSAVIRRIIESPVSPAVIVLTVQEEVASRICALPGEMSLLALGVQYYGRPSICGKIPGQAFYPAPKVDSAIVKVDLRQAPVRDPEEADRLFRAARAGFSQKRKTLRNTLSAGLRIPTAEAERALLQAGVQPRRRAETLSVEEWITLSRLLEG